MPFEKGKARTGAGGLGMYVLGKNKGKEQQTHAERLADSSPSVKQETEGFSPAAQVHVGAALPREQVADKNPDVQKTR